MQGKQTLAAIVLAAATLPAFAAHWSLSGDVGMHDPSIIKEGSTYWAFSTGEGIQVLYSDSTGKKFSRGIQVLSTRPTWWSSYVPEHKGLDVWAPDVQQFNGKVWLYYSISTFGSNTSAIGLLKASSVAKGDWVDQGLVIRSKAGSNDYNAIDPNLTTRADPARITGIKHRAAARKQLFAVLVDIGAGDAFRATVNDLVGAVHAFATRADRSKQIVITALVHQ